ncbi:MAG: glycosyltransferase family 39 protein [Hyphomicrobiales bacterium]|nr:glycosyltransferase family 39 protein [Hyphomicrobiales bacterium]
MKLPTVPAPVVRRLTRLAEIFDDVADRRFGFLDEERRFGLLLAALLLGHVIVWTLQPMLAHENLADSVDMVENWVWGQEWRLGYWKHPPFFAWVVGAWFAVLPRADWAYYLLAAVNSAVGLAGVFAATGVVDADRPDRGRRRRLLGLAGLAITPIWGFLALKFNANAILLAVWPWAAWAFLRALRAPTAGNGAILGLMLAVAMLSKYVSAVVIVGMIVVILLDPRRWTLLRSPAAIAALLVGLVAIAPHAVWMVETEFRTLAYAEHQRAASTGQFLNYLVRLPLSMLLFLAPMIGLTLVALPREQWWALKRVFARRASDAGRRHVLDLGVSAFVVTCLLGVWKWAKLSSQWGFPLMWPAGWLLVSAPGVDDRRIRLDRAAAVVALVWAGLLVTAPLVDAVGVMARTKVHVEPRAEIAREANRIWREASGGAPLRIVAGSFDLASNTSFYAPDAPSMLIEFDREKSPWITPERIAREGVLVVCRLEDPTCDAEAAKLGVDPTPREISVSKRWYGLSLKPLAVRLFLRLPEKGA